MTPEGKRWKYQYGGNLTYEIVDLHGIHPTIRLDASRYNALTPEEGELKAKQIADIMNS